MSFDKENPKFVVLRDASPADECLLEYRWVGSELEDLIGKKVQVVGTTEGDSRTEYCEILAVCGKCKLPALFIKASQDIVDEKKYRTTVRYESPTDDEQGKRVCPEL